MIKILSIGNSFSEDAQDWLHAIAVSGGVDCLCANLNIGGCPLHDHWSLAQSGEARYVYQENGAVVETRALVDTLRAEAWDIVTLQQVSGLSGRYETFQPHLDGLAATIRRECPTATIWWHKTWAYELDSQHPHFMYYNCDQHTMHTAIGSATKLACTAIGAQAIPSGDVIAYLRANAPAFDYANGGLSLCRDGFHMSLDYGRYAVAAAWFVTLLDGDIMNAPFAPEGTDATLIDVIKNAVNTVCGG